MAPAPRPPNFTVTGLKRWSCLNKEIPAVSQIKAIHVYDFDNTLFSSPLPNPQVWNGQTIGWLQNYDCFANGGWWHDPNLLAATGEGIEKEEPEAWKGWWNEQIVQLVELSMQQKDALTVLLTGRAEGTFSGLVKRIVASKKLDFDLIGLKPEVGPNNQHFSTTMLFKQAFLQDLVFTYKGAEEIRVYEDRVKHVKGFREYFEKLNKSLLSHPIDTPAPPRRPITAEVIHVAEGATFLNPVTEVAEVQRMINSHNLSCQAANNTHPKNGRLQIKRTFVYCGYLINAQDSARLITLASVAAPQIDAGEVKYMANSILITPRPAPRTVLDRVGGIGKKVTWQVTGTAVFENKVWAARVEPTSPNEKYHTENPAPIVVLALRKGARPIDAGRIQNWQPVSSERALIFDTVVGDKIVLRVENEDSGESEWESLFVNKTNKRKQPFDNGASTYAQRDREYGQGDRDIVMKDRDDYVSNRNDSFRQGERQGQGRFGNNGDDGRRNFSGHNSRGGGGQGRGGGGNGSGSRGQNQGADSRRNNNANYNSGTGGGRGGRGNERRDRGGGRNRGGRDGGRGAGPSGYKSLDDYPGGGYDGAYDDKGSNGQMVMNY